MLNESRQQQQLGVQSPAVDGGRHVTVVWCAAILATGALLTLVVILRGAAPAERPALLVALAAVVAACRGKLLYTNDVQHPQQLAVTDSHTDGGAERGR